MAILTVCQPIEYEPIHCHPSTTLLNCRSLAALERTSEERRHHSHAESSPSKPPLLIDLQQARIDLWSSSVPHQRGREASGRLTRNTERNSQ